MARSTYIYVVEHYDGPYKSVAGTFTVKHECLSYLRTCVPFDNLEVMTVTRHRDGYPEHPLVSLDAKEFVTS